MRFSPRVIALSVIALSFVMGCADDSTTISGPPTTSNLIVSDTLTGTIKGTMKAGKTYYLVGDVRVQSGDTLVAQPGVRLIALTNNTLFVSGSIIAVGTRDSMIYFGPADNNKIPGAWGGIECDTPSVVTLKFCRVMYGSGVRPDGRSRPEIYVISKPNNGTTITVEDSEFSYTKDDGLEFDGGKGHILRCTFRMNGVVEGSGFNFRLGFIGYGAYNYIWSTNDHAIRIQTSNAVLFPQTVADVYNNTIINFGHKNVARPGAGIMYDFNARGNIYNNIIVNGRVGLRITPQADTANVRYGNNLFFSTIDSLRQYYWVDRAVRQSTDLVDVDPKFVSLDPNREAAADNNDARLQAGSPAIGKGNPLYDSDLGCFTAKGQQ